MVPITIADASRTDSLGSTLFVATGCSIFNCRNRELEVTVRWTSLSVEKCRNKTEFDGRGRPSYLKRQFLPLCIPQCPTTFESATFALRTRRHLMLLTGHRVHRFGRLSLLPAIRRTRPTGFWAERFPVTPINATDIRMPMFWRRSVGNCIGPITRR